MKISKNFPKISPEEFAKARDTIKQSYKEKTMEPLLYRHLSNEKNIKLD